MGDLRSTSNTVQPSVGPLPILRGRPLLRPLPRLCFSQRSRGAGLALSIPYRVCPQTQCVVVEGARVRRERVSLGAIAVVGKHRVIVAWWGVRAVDDYW